MRKTILWHRELPKTGPYGLSSKNHCFKRYIYLIQVYRPGSTEQWDGTLIGLT